MTTTPTALLLPNGHAYHYRRLEANPLYGPSHQVQLIGTFSTPEGAHSRGLFHVVVDEQLLAPEATNDLAALIRHKLLEAP